MAEAIAVELAFRKKSKDASTYYLTNNFSLVKTFQISPSLACHTHGTVGFSLVQLHSSLWLGKGTCILGVLHLCIPWNIYFGAHRPFFSVLQIHLDSWLSLDNSLAVWVYGVG